MVRTNIPNLTEDILKNIYIMAPMLDEIAQNRVFGLMCGLIKGEKAESPKKRVV